MRAQNHKEIYRAYWIFSGYLALTVLVGVLSYWTYTKTVKVEVERIVDKTEEYDKIYVRQMDLATRVDSLYRYTTMLNTNLNDALLLNSISKRKQEILSSMDDMSSRDIRMYQKLLSEVNTFLAVKDSIRILRTQEELVKSDLMKCVEDNKQTTRKLTLGGITVKK